MRRYIVHPGSIHSKNDNDVHHIGFAQLVRLYGVDPRLCTTAGPGLRDQPGDVHLYPDYHGNYQLPEGSTDEPAGT